MRQPLAAFCGALCIPDLSPPSSAQSGLVTMSARFCIGGSQCVCLGGNPLDLPQACLFLTYFSLFIESSASRAGSKYHVTFFSRMV
jgi:hypothetical protein